MSISPEALAVVSELRELIAEERFAHMADSALKTLELARKIRGPGDLVLIQKCHKKLVRHLIRVELGDCGGTPEVYLQVRVLELLKRLASVSGWSYEGGKWVEFPRGSEGRAA